MEILDINSAHGLLKIKVRFPNELQQVLHYVGKWKHPKEIKLISPIDYALSIVD